MDAMTAGAWAESASSARQELCQRGERAARNIFHRGYCKLVENQDNGHRAQFRAADENNTRIMTMAKKYLINAAGVAAAVAEAVGVCFDFTKDGGEKHTILASEVPGYVDGLSGTALHGLLHGISQKGGDSYAVAKNQANPLAWAQEQVKAVIDSIKKGVWNAGRTGEGGVRVSILARALHRIKAAAGDTESSEAAAQAYLDELEKQADGKAQIAAIRAKKKVARMLDTLRLEDAQKRLERAQKAAAAGVTDEDEDETEAA
jgi:hypothetical protein